MLMFLVFVTLQAVRLGQAALAFVHKPDGASGSEFTVYFGVTAFKAFFAHIGRIF